MIAALLWIEAGGVVVIALGWWLMARRGWRPFDSDMEDQ